MALIKKIWSFLTIGLHQIRCGLMGHVIGEVLTTYESFKVKRFVTRGEAISAMQKGVLSVNLYEKKKCICAHCGCVFMSSK